MNEIQEQLGLDDDQYGKLKLFNRVLISYNDFDQAYEVASILVEGEWYEHYPRENRQLVLALNMAAIVAYSRPFLDSKGDLAHNRLPGKALRILSANEKEVHEAVIHDRNTMMAHSDADPNIAFPLVMDLNGTKTVIPKNASPYSTPLLPEAMAILQGMSLKLREYCFELRQKMEPELIEFLPEAQFTME